MPTRVDRPMHPPHQCSFTLKGEDPEGFYQGLVMSGWDPSASIAVSFARTLARDLGYIHPDDHAQTLEDLDAARDRISELEVENAELRGQFDAIDVLASAGFQARKKAGRPPAKSTKQKETV